MNHPNDSNSHDGLRYRENHLGGGAASDPEAEADCGAGLDEIRQRAANIGSEGQRIIANAMSNNSTQYLTDIRQEGGE